MTDINENEASKLFNEVSKAMQEDDGGKLSELLAKDSSEDEATIDTPDPADEPDQEDDEENDSPPEDQPDDEGDEPEEKKDDEAGKDEDDPLKELREQLAALQKENQSLRSQAGRVPHVQRKLDEIDKKLKQLTTSPSSQASAKITPKVEEQLKEIEETDPALAKAVRSALASAIDGYDEEQRSREIAHLNALREEETKAYQQAEAQRLLEMIPNAPEVFASPHWSEWKKSQPEHIVNLAQSNNADAVAMAIQLYAKDMQEKFPQHADSNKVMQNEQANKVEEQRQRKQQTAANLNGSKLPPKDKGPQNPEALFAKFSEEIRKELRG